MHDSHATRPSPAAFAQLKLCVAKFAKDFASSATPQNLGEFHERTKQLATKFECCRLECASATVKPLTLERRPVNQQRCEGKVSVEAGQGLGKMRTARVTVVPQTDFLLSGAHLGIQYHRSSADSILYLFPTADQFGEMHGAKEPSMLRAAKDLAAEKQGAFVIKIPTSLRQQSTQNIDKKYMCTKYVPKPLGSNFWRLEKSQYMAVLRPALGYKMVDPEGGLEEHLVSDGHMSGVCYRTDVCVDTEAKRKKAGLPQWSPVSPLPWSKLKLTAYKVFGIHTPSMFEGTAHAPFTWHEEDGLTWSINYLYEGTKHWHVVSPGHREAFKMVIKGLMLLPEASQCNSDQFLRHDAIFGTRGLDIPVSSFDQCEGEVVITFPGAFHSGFSRCYTKAEAMNFADEAWNPDNYQFCTKVCPKGSITAEDLGILPEADQISNHDQELEAEQEEMEGGKGTADDLELEDDQEMENDRDMEVHAPPNTAARGTMTTSSSKRASAGPELTARKKPRTELVMKILDHILLGKWSTTFEDIERGFRFMNEPISLRIDAKQPQAYVRAYEIQQKLSDRTLLFAYLRRLVQLRMLQMLEDGGRKRIPTQRYEDIMQSRNITRRQLRRELNGIRAMRKICSGPGKGLLPFLPHDNDYYLHDITEDEIRELHSLLKNLQHKDNEAQKAARAVTEAGSLSDMKELGAKLENLVATYTDYYVY